MTAFNRFNRAHPKLCTYLRNLLYGMGCAFIIAISSSESPFAAALSITVMLILAIPVVLILILQGSYYIYGWFKYGNPFHDETRPYVYETIVRKEVKARAWCPICKENTGCRVRRNESNGMTVHVLAGGGRPVKM